MMIRKNDDYSFFKSINTRNIQDIFRFTSLPKYFIDHNKTSK